MSGALSALQPGGFLVYTGQPWHPQLKIIWKQQCIVESLYEYLQLDSRKTI
ncbi:MAG: class I SAM-dependent methyltransferase family protein [Veillonella parvula]